MVDFLNQVMTVIGLCLGIFLLVRGLWGITLGDLAAFFLISSFIYRPLKKLAQGWVRFVDSMAGAERFLELMDKPIEIRPIDPIERSRPMKMCSTWAAIALASFPAVAVACAALI